MIIHREKKNYILLIQSKQYSCIKGKNNKQEFALQIVNNQISFCKFNLKSLTLPVYGTKAKCFDR